MKFTRVPVFIFPVLQRADNARGCIEYVKFISG